MTAEPDKLDLKSLDLTAEKQADLLRLFPEIRTEGGKIDFDRLKLALGETVDVGRERYGLTWPGKADCFKTIQAPSLGTLRPVPDESVNFDTTENLIIEGDNLEVLKLLQKSYLGKIKMIYIDPPYNTGNDFIYPDNFGENLQTYLEYTGQVDSQGRKFGTNTETDGRFHSRWLSMMYPRLYLARNLLSDDGLIFVNIDESEVVGLRHIMSDIYGEENFIANISWEKRYTRSNNAKMFYSLKDSIVVFRKTDAVNSIKEPRNDGHKASYSNVDNDERGDWASSSYVNPATKEQRPNLTYAIRNPSSGEMIEHPTHAWKYEYSEHLRHVNERLLWWGQKGDAKYPRLKNFLEQMSEGIVPVDVWNYEDTGTTDEGGIQLKELFGEAIFDTPKPTKLIKRMMNLLRPSDEETIILDFFAGSGTTAQAVQELNNEDGGKRRFILIQLPEPTDRSDYSTIAEITKERVRRAIKKLNDEDEDKLDLNQISKQDRGFRVFKLAESNFMGWEADVSADADALGKQLDLSIDHVRQGRKDDDLFYELLLKSGFPLTTPVEKLTLAGKTVYSIGGGVFLICLERDLTLEAIRAMADMKPSRVVCLDDGFRGNDQLKSNAVLTFKTKGVAKFQTV